MWPTRLDRQALPRELVDHHQQLQLPAVFRAVRHEVVAPHVVGMRSPVTHTTVDWIKTVPLGQAIKEKGFFGNQNTVAAPKTPKWNHTIDRLKQRFEVS